MDDTNAMTGEAVSFPALFRDAALLFKSPRRFFRGMAKGGGYVTPALTLAFWSFVSTVISFLLSFVWPRLMPGNRVVQLLLSPLVTVAAMFFFAAFLFVVWHLMGSRENYQASFRVLAFVSPLSVAGALLGPIPYGGLLVFVAFFFLIILASEEVHGLSRERSWLVWGIIGGVLLVMGVLGSAAVRTMQGSGGPAVFSTGVR